MRWLTWLAASQPTYNVREFIVHPHTHTSMHHRTFVPFLFEYIHALRVAWQENCPVASGFPRSCKPNGLVYIRTVRRRYFASSAKRQARKNRDQIYDTKNCELY